jgi:hypothetical protein
MFSLLCACTDRRPKTDFPNSVHVTPPEQILPVAEVQFEGQSTEAQQMVVRGGSLFLTGRPFGFSRWDVGANAESPRLTFAASDQITTFSPYPKFGFWTPDAFGQGGLEILGSTALMSGAAGLSIVDISQTHTPVEVGRHPEEKKDNVQVTSHPDFIYSAIVSHPSLPIFYGFRQEDYVVTSRLEGGKSAVPIEKAAYGSSNVCCVAGAGVFANRVLVAMQGSLWVFNFLQDGRLSTPSEFDELSAVNVVAGAEYVYVQHTPTNARPNAVNHPGGIYVFDAGGNNVAFLPITPLRFAVYNDQYLYANEDNTRIRIYKMVWTK